MQNLRVTFRLRPTEEQEILFAKTVGCCRLVYNTLLAARIEAYKAKLEGKVLKIPTEKELKSEFEFLKEVDAYALVQSGRDLDTAYKNFFKKTGKFPKFKKKGKSRESFRCGQTVYAIPEEGKLRIAKYGEVEASGDWSQLYGKVKSITVYRDGNRWYASMLLEVDDNQYFIPTEHRFDSVGIDLGVVKPLTLAYEAGIKGLH